MILKEDAEKCRTDGTGRVVVDRKNRRRATSLRCEQ